MLDRLWTDFGQTVKLAARIRDTDRTGSAFQISCLGAVTRAHCDLPAWQLGWANRSPGLRHRSSPAQRHIVCHVVRHVVCHVVCQVCLTTWLTWIHLAFPSRVEEFLALVVICGQARWLGKSAMRSPAPRAYQVRHSVVQESRCFKSTDELR